MSGEKIAPLGAGTAGSQPSASATVPPNTPVYRMLEVEVAANAVYQWAAERIVERRQAELGRTANPADHARAVYLEAQALRHRSHERLMRAFLDPEVFDGRVRVEPDRVARRSRQEPLSNPSGRPPSPSRASGSTRR